LVRYKLLLIPGRTADPAEITRARAAVDSLYRSRSFYLARIDVDSASVDDGIAVTFRISEGRRLAISGISIEGNSRLSDDEIVGAMATKPEGFLFTNTGEFDDDTYGTDLAISIPELYANRGFLDMRVVRDTLIIDPEIGK